MASKRFRGEEILAKRQRRMQLRNDLRLCFRADGQILITELLTYEGLQTGARLRDVDRPRLRRVATHSRIREPDTAEICPNVSLGTQNRTLIIKIEFREWRIHCQLFIKATKHLFKVLRPRRRLQ